MSSFKMLLDAALSALVAFFLTYVFPPDDPNLIASVGLFIILMIVRHWREMQESDLASQPMIYFYEYSHQLSRNLSNFRELAGKSKNLKEKIIHSRHQDKRKSNLLADIDEAHTFITCIGKAIADVDDTLNADKQRYLISKQRYKLDYKTYQNVINFMTNCKTQYSKLVPIFLRRSKFGEPANKSYFEALILLMHSLKDIALHLDQVIENYNKTWERLEVELAIQPLQEQTIQGNSQSRQLFQTETQSAPKKKVE